jgi:hypothetical protein
MKNARHFAPLFILVLIFTNSCNKLLVIPQPATATSSHTSNVLFWNIVINTNSQFSFSIPQITRSVLDSGGVSVYFRSSLVVFDTWYQLPYFSTNKGNSSSMTVSKLQLGSITIQNNGATDSSADYRFEIFSSN